MPTTGWRNDPPKLPDMEKVNAAMDRHRKERELKDAVVEAAKATKENSSSRSAWKDLWNALEALLHFEEQQK